MIDPALVTLLRLHFRAVMRRLGKGFRSARGILYLVIGLGVGVIYLGPRVFFGLRAADPDTQPLLEVFPIVLLSICMLTLLTNGGGKAFYFTPAEVDFLFPGPFLRKQVLLYKITKSMGAALLGSLFFSCFLLSRVHHWFAGYLAVVLSMIFLQMFSMTLVLAGQTVAARVITGRGKWLLAGLIVAVTVVAWHFTPHISGPVTKEVVLDWIRNTRAAQVVLAPFSVFARVAASRRLLGDLPIHAAIAAMIDAVLLVVVLWLDSDYMEASAASSEKVHARRMRARRGQGFVSATVATGIHVPSVGFLFGVGPLAWRQITGAARTARTTLILFFVATLLAAAFVKQFLHVDPLVPTLCIAGWLILFTTNLLRFDFRGDLEQMDVLKSLPVRPWAVVFGEVAAPTLILSAMHIFLLIGLSVTAPIDRTIALAAALLVVPVNLIFALFENYIFLLFPVREMTVSPGDLQGTGRRMVVLVTKMVGISIVGAIAGLAAAGAYAAGGHSMMIACLVAALVVCGFAIGIVPLLSHAFVRFDPSVDTPT